MKEIGSKQSKMGLEMYGFILKSQMWYKISHLP